MMDTLPKDILFTIIKKIAALRAEELIKFETSFPFYQEFTRNHAVLKALPRKCLWYLTDHSPSERKLKLMREISHGGFGMYRVASVAQILRRDNPDLGEIKLILKEAVIHRSNCAKYFDLILKVLAEDDFSFDEVFPAFIDLFKRKQHAECRRALVNVGGIPFYWEPYWTRPLPLGLKHRFVCTSKGTCKGYGRKPTIFWPFPGDDEQYLTMEFCSSCRLEVEVAWFLLHFRFLKDVRF